MLIGKVAVAVFLGGLAMSAVVGGEDSVVDEAAVSVTAKHEWTDQTARIQVSGLEKAVRVLHITDLHLNVFDERDQAYIDKLAGRHLKFLENPFEEHFQKILAEVPAIKPDFIAITGDIIHFPSQKSIELVKTAMDATGIPWMFVTGNHDWHWPYDKETDDLRAVWIDKLRPLTEGEDPAMRVKEFGGIRFVALDDTTYSFTQAQVNFFKKQLDAGGPVVLLAHIPLYAPDLREKAVVVWKPHSLTVGDPNWIPEERKGWGAPLEDTPETLAVVETAKTAPNLVAVLAGHLHFPHAEKIGPNAVQYVGQPPFQDLGRRVLDFVPLETEE